MNAQGMAGRIRNDAIQCHAPEISNKAMSAGLDQA